MNPVLPELPIRRLGETLGGAAPVSVRVPGVPVPRGGAR